MTNHTPPAPAGGPADLLAILAEAFIKWQRPCRMYGLDISAVDMTVSIEPSPAGWRIFSMAPARPVRIA